MEPKTFFCIRFVLRLKKTFIYIKTVQSELNVNSPSLQFTALGDGRFYANSLKLPIFLLLIFNFTVVFQCMNTG